MDFQYARNVSVSYHLHYKVVRVSTAGVAGMDSEDGPALTDTVLLVQCGTPLPRLEGTLADAPVITVPAMTVAANHDHDVTRVDRLGYTRRITAMGSGGIYDPELRQRWEDGLIESIGSSFHGATDLETVLMLDPDVFLATMASLDHSESLDRARNLGIDIAPTFSWSESTYLGQAEWIKHAALFLNAEGQANVYFERVADRSRVLITQASDQARRPTAIWADYEGGGRWIVHRRSFQAALLQDAGAENLLAGEASNSDRLTASYANTLVPTGVPMSSEELLLLGAEADLWVTRSTSDENWPSWEYLTGFKAYREGRVFHVHKRTRFEHNAYDWYETAVVRPDMLLADLVALLYPDVLPGHVPDFLGLQERTKGPGAR